MCETLTSHVLRNAPYHIKNCMRISEISIFFKVFTELNSKPNE
jgi:hypothetical protein